eukprot:5593817-Amphidinium_carterae.1
MRMRAKASADAERVLASGKKDAATTLESSAVRSKHKRVVAKAPIPATPTLDTDAFVNFPQ